MNYVSETLQALKAVSISELTIGDSLVNLGTVLEINENENSFSLVIERMGQRQVWDFSKTEEVIIKSDL